MARLGETVAEVTENLEKYQVRESAISIERLLDDLSRWYIRRSRRRFSAVFKGGAGGGREHTEASQTLGMVLSEMNKLMAPFVPFLSEAVYRELGAKKEESVHLTNWPSVGKSQIINRSSLIDGMADIRRIASSALAKRAEIGIKVRQPLAELRIKDQSSIIKKNKELLEILKDEVNVKKITFGAKISGDIEFDTVITPELKKEGTIRELIRTVQELRQEAGLKPGDSIDLMLDLPAEIKSAVSSNEKFLKSEVGAKSLAYKKSGKFLAEAETKIDNLKIRIGVKKAK
ncbi:MAG: class I tRNA ligase family protein [Candidatus Liptonbacteria bacterium]|nr:class I tRNA ligase family protein [Candidatus Liptonbacteria bacterium]